MSEEFTNRIMDFPASGSVSLFKLLPKDTIIENNHNNRFCDMVYARLMENSRKKRTTRLFQVNKIYQFKFSCIYKSDIV